MVQGLHFGAFERCVRSTTTCTTVFTSHRHKRSVSGCTEHCRLLSWFRVQSAEFGVRGCREAHRFPRFHCLGEEGRNRRVRELSPLHRVLPSLRPCVLGFGAPGYDVSWARNGFWETFSGSCVVPCNRLYQSPPSGPSTPKCRVWAVPGLYGWRSG